MGKLRGFLIPFVADDDRNTIFDPGTSEGSELFRLAHSHRHERSCYFGVYRCFWRCVPGECPSWLEGGIRYLSWQCHRQLSSLRRPYTSGGPRVTLSA